MNSGVAQAEIIPLTAEEEVVHVRKHDRAPRTLCGLTISGMNSEWPRGHTYMDRDQLTTARIVGTICTGCHGG